MLSSLSSTIRTVLAMPVSFPHSGPADGFPCRVRSEAPDSVAASASSGRGSGLRRPRRRPARRPVTTRWGASTPAAMVFKATIAWNSYVNANGGFLMKSVTRLTVDDAEAIAIQGLQFMAGDPEQLGRFLAVTGIDRRRCGRRRPSRGVPCTCWSSSWPTRACCCAFASNAGIRPTLFAAARHLLGGRPGEA